MSGVEAAGLALAVFPLLISALEHYRESAEVLGDWWKFKRKYTKCKRDIEYHQITYTANLEELLLPLIADDDDLDDLIADPGGANWRDPNLEARLKERLPNTYDAYLDSMSEISSIMKDLKKELGLENVQLQERVASNEVKSGRSRSTKENLGYQGQRIKFALGQTNRDKLLDDFAKYNGRLRDLLRTGDRISAIKKSTRSPKMGVILMSLWRHAKALYASIFDSWGCECRDKHRANLLLCHRETAADINFNLLLYSAQDLSRSLWGWQEAMFSFSEEDNQDSITNSLQTSTSSLFEAPLRSTSSPSILKNKSTFSRPSILSRSRVSTMTASSTSTLTYSSTKNGSATFVGVKWTDTQSTLVDEHEAVSKSMRPPGTKELCFHFRSEKSSEVSLTDETSDNCYTMKAEKSDDRDLIKLDDLLTSNYKASFPRRKRYQLAHILASSQAQLQSTPWLRGEWRKNDVLFSKNEKNTISIDKPHLVSDFTDTTESNVNDDRSVASLGMVLLELCFGTLLEEHPIRQRLPVLQGPQNFYLDLAAALEWSTQVVEEAGPAYANAVKWCLSQPAVPDKGEKWRAELFENVVKPLQECHQHLA